MSENVSKLIDALQSGDMATANSVFQDDIAGRMSAVLDAEKIGVASSVFGAADEIESDTPDEEWDDTAEEEVEDDFEEELDVPEEDE